MLKLLETARVLHVESTDVCQASCPACARETDPRFDKRVHNSHSLQSFQQAVSERLIYQLDKLFMCGNYGDPAANEVSKSIFSYVRSINSSTVLGMNTNGGLQGSYWWADLANVLHKPQDYVVFSIDGLEDTNHIYRRGVNWSRVMQNAETFIRAGGSAHWDMLVFRHNEHQVDACEQLARDMGFKWFRAKVSKRGLVGDLEFPVGWQPSQTNFGNIQCRALQEDSMYIDVHGRITPCTWLNSFQKVLVTDDLETVKEEELLSRSKNCV